MVDDGLQLRHLLVNCLSLLQQASQLPLSGLQVAAVSAQRHGLLIIHYWYNRASDMMRFYAYVVQSASEAHKEPTRLRNRTFVLMRQTAEGLRGQEQG